MKYIIGLISASLLSISVQANELNSEGWNFPSPDHTQVSLNRVSLLCSADPSRCPAGLLGRGAGANAAGTGLISPNTNSSANNISVVLAGDNSSVTLSTDQDADDNTIGADSTIDAVIDHEQVLNFESSESSESSE